MGVGSALGCYLEGSRVCPWRGSHSSLTLEDKEDFSRWRFLEVHSMPREEDEKRPWRGKRKE